MLKNNKMSRVILALLMTLNINIFSPSITNAKPVEDSYYNPYTHGVEVENKTFNANGESNSDRQAREKREAEAKKQAEAQKAQEQARKSDADKFKDFKNEFGNKSVKENNPSLRIGKEEKKGPTEKQKVDTDVLQFSDENIDKFKNLAKTKCNELADKLETEKKSLKVEGQVLSPKEICSEKLVKDIAICFALFSYDDNGNPQELSPEMMNDCVEGYLATGANSTKTAEDWFEETKNSLANYVVEKTGWEWAGDLIRDITPMDIIEEVVFTAGLSLLTLATGGLAGGALLARIALLGSKANKAFKLVKAGKKAEALSKTGSRLKEGFSAVKEARKGAKKTYGEMKDSFIKETEKTYGQKFKNLDEAIEYVENKSISGANKADKTLEGFKDIGKNLKSFKNNNKIDELGEKTIQEIEKNAKGDPKQLAKLEKSVEKAQKKGNKNKLKIAQERLDNYKETQKIAMEQAEEKINKIAVKSSESLEKASEKLHKLTTTKLDRNPMKATIGGGLIGGSGAIATKDYFLETKPKEQQHYEEHKTELTKQNDMRQKVQEAYTARNNAITETQYPELNKKIQTLEQEKEAAMFKDDGGKSFDEIDKQLEKTKKMTNEIASENNEIKQNNTRIQEINSFQKQEYTNYSNQKRIGELSQDNINTKEQNMRSEANQIKSKAGK